jgi:hypothetical protein
VAGHFPWGRLIWFLTLALVLSIHPVLAQSEAERYFPETGHWVTGEFLTAYEKAPAPHDLYGNPITDAFPEKNSERVIQYFEKARFVLDPQSPPDLRIQLSPLGELLPTPGTATTHSPTARACRHFPETGFSVCYAFLDFFNSNGQVAQFGYPISDFKIHDGRIVQYFQRARFEWHPELSPGQRVTLGDLGAEYFAYAGENPLLLLPTITDNIPQTILSLRVYAFTSRAVMPLQGEQTLFVAILDQNLRPVSNAQVSVSVRVPGRDPVEYSLSPTDKNGLTRLSFPIIAENQGVAEILVKAVFEAFQQQTLTSFRIWW